jgi:hypothetical protein
VWGVGYWVEGPEDAADFVAVLVSMETAHEGDIQGYEGIYKTAHEGDIQRCEWRGDSTGTCPYVDSECRSSIQYRLHTGLCIAFTYRLHTGLQISFT